MRLFTATTADRGGLAHSRPAVGESRAAAEKHDAGDDAPEVGTIADRLRITLSSACARLATDATSSSSRLVSAVLATVRAVRLRFAVCSRKARPPDASGVPASPPPCGLSAKAKLN